MPLDWLSAEEWTAVRLSLLVASTAVAVSLPVGIALAYLLARGRFYGKILLDTLIHLPLILPPVVTGYLLLLSFGRKAPTEPKKRVRNTRRWLQTTRRAPWACCDRRSR